MQERAIIKSPGLNDNIKGTPQAIFKSSDGHIDIVLYFGERSYKEFLTIIEESFNGKEIINKEDAPRAKTFEYPSEEDLHKDVKDGKKN